MNLPGRKKSKRFQELARRRSWAFTEDAPTRRICASGCSTQAAPTAPGQALCSQPGVCSEGARPSAPTGLGHAVASEQPCAKQACRPRAGAGRTGAGPQRPDAQSPVRVGATGAGHSGWHYCDVQDPAPPWLDTQKKDTARRRSAPMSRWPDRVGKPGSPV